MRMIPERLRGARRVCARFFHEVTEIDFHLVWIVHLKQRILDSVQKDHFLLFRELQRPFFARHAAYIEIDREQQGFEPRWCCRIGRVPYD
jgi:hypothetical protein